MTKRTKRLLVTLCVIAGVIIAASIILRVVLTKERLTAIIVPRIEARVGANIEFTDIGIRFPFGFGVRIDGLKVAKALPEGGIVDLSAAKFNVDVSLMSLIRRRPEVKSVKLGGATLSLAGTQSGIDVEIDGLDARLSMTPSDSIFILDPNVSAEKIAVITRATGERIELPPLSFGGRLEAPADLSRAVVKDGRLVIADLAALQIDVDVVDLQGNREFTMPVKSSDLDAKQLMDLVTGMNLTGPALSAEKDGAGEKLNFVVESGTVGIELKVAGMVSDPSGVVVGGMLDLERLVVIPKEGPKLTAGGTVQFSNSNVSSKGVSLETERSKATVAFGIDMDKAEKKPKYVSFDVRARSDLGEVSAMMPAEAAPKGAASSTAIEPMQMEGILNVSVKGGAQPVTLRNLFPLKDGGSTPAKISRAWKDLDLTGTVDLFADELPGEKGPASISSLKTTASIDGGSVKTIDASFEMGGRPWKIQGEMKDVMPALAELMLVAEKGDLPQMPGPILDALVNSPDMSIYVEGRAFDAAAFQEASEKEKLSADKTSGGGGAGAPGGAASANPLVANPMTLLMLKKTFVSVKIDSIISKGAVLTSLDAQGRISNGVLRASPVTVEYAGGKGSGRLISDFRDPSRISNDIDIDFSGIDAGKALSGFHSAGGLVSGTFAMKLDGRFTAGPGMDILQNLTATGKATSTSGTVDLSRFMAPLKSTGLNISSIERFDFHEWTEKFVIEKGRVGSELWKIRSKNGDWDIAGSFGFDGTLDYKAGLVITPRQQADMKDLARYSAIIDLFRDDEGNILLMLDIGGTAKQPKVRLDQSKAKEKAGKKLLDGAKDKLKDLFK